MFTHINHKQVLLTSAATVFLRPAVEHLLCPYLQNYQSETINSICKIAVITAEVTPTVIGVTYGASSVATQIANSGIKGLAAGYKINLWNFVLPAGLGATNAQSYFMGKDVPGTSILVGALKSSFEMTAIGAISKTLGVEKDMATTLFIATIVSSATNSIYHAATAVVNGVEHDADKILSDASDYALALAIARPLYQAGKYLGDSGYMASSYACYFGAPVFRGAVLGLIEKGSVLLPGSNHGLFSNVLDGFAIATVSVSIQISGRREAVANSKDHMDNLAEALRVGLALGATGYKLYNSFGHMVFDDEEVSHKELDTCSMEDNITALLGVTDNSTMCIAHEGL